MQQPSHLALSFFCPPEPIIYTRPEENFKKIIWHITPQLKTLSWFPVALRLDFTSQRGPRPACPPHLSCPALLLPKGFGCPGLFRSVELLKPFLPQGLCTCYFSAWKPLPSGDGGLFPPFPIPILKLPEYREGLSWELFPRCSIHRFLKTHLHPSPGFSYFCKFTEPVFWGKRGRPQVGSALIHSMSVIKTGPLLFA